jgi:hypothetical protein
VGVLASCTAREEVGVHRTDEPERTDKLSVGHSFINGNMLAFSGKYHAAQQQALVAYV